MASVTMTINGRSVTRDVEDRTLLVDYIRNQVGLTGTHVGCDTSQCGACLVLVDGRAVKSCTMLTYTFILSLFAGVIAFGVVYNSARISLSERDRELASLRVLGLTRGEVAYILLGELAVLTLLAIPLGFLLGAGASTAVVKALQTDMYQLPFVLSRHTLALAAVVVLAAAVISALIVNHRLNRLDLIGVLKTRE